MLGGLVGAGPLFFVGAVGVYGVVLPCFYGLFGVMMGRKKAPGSLRGRGEVNDG